MNIWLLHVGEDLPTDDQPRKFRYGYLADALVARGHSVLRWAPTFHHYRKQQRFAGDHRTQVNAGYAIQFVASRPYRRNVSLARVRCYRELANRFAELAPTEAPPDLIVAGIPSLEWCRAAVDFGDAAGVPVVIDARDRWPDVYLNALPRRLRPAGRACLAPVRRGAAATLRRATALTAVSQSYLDWALELAGRGAGPLDAAIPLGYARRTQPAAQREGRLAHARSLGVDTNKTLALFVGLLESSYDVEALASAAARLQQRADVQVVVCGDGKKRGIVEQAARQLNNVKYLGWVDPPMIAALASRSAIGLAAYAPGALQSLPNKLFEYMAGGLAIVNSLPGEAAQLVADHGCGAQYTAGDAGSLARAVEGLAAEPTRLAESRRNARRLFDAQFSIGSLYPRFAELLEQAVDPPTAVLARPRLAA